MNSISAIIERDYIQSDITAERFGGGMMSMSKKLREMPNQLSSCKTEEEVKGIFSRAFGIDLNTSNKIDLYTEEALFEFKYERNLEKTRQRARIIAQALYYIYKLKNGRDIRSIPPIICVVDKNMGFTVVTSKYKSIFGSEKYDWDRAASTPDPMIVEAVQKCQETTSVHTYRFSHEEDYENFVSHINVIMQRQLSMDIGDSIKKSINEASFDSVFTLWKRFFEDYVQNGTKSSEYFLADIREGGSYILSDDGQIAFELSSSVLRKKPIPMQNYKFFWDTYAKCKDTKTIVGIRQKIDRLTKEDMRRRTGEFYTPIEFAQKAIKYIEKTIGKRWWDKGYRLWDMAAGSGNLEYELPEESLPYCYISTLLQDDANYCEQLYPMANVFQYDYLNDDVKMLFEKKINPLEIGVNTKMPLNLLNDLRNPDIKWIIFINPPFATANEGKRLSKVDKNEVSFTEVRQLMSIENLGEVSRELYAQFMWRIGKEFENKTAYLGMFSKIKYINSNNDQKMRDSFFRYKFECGFCFSSAAFHGSRGLFPVGFLMWNLSKYKQLNKQKIILDIFNDDLEKIGIKTVSSYERTELLSKWVERYRNTEIMPPLSAALTVASGNKDVRDRVAPDFIGSLMAKGNDFQNQNYTAILSSPYVSAGAFSITPNNFEKAMVVHTVRRLPKATWLNDRDQFLAPMYDKLNPEFICDCVVWSLFSSSNNSASMTNVAYKKSTYQIKNHFYPFLLSTVKKWKCSLFTVQSNLASAKDDRFAAKWISMHSKSHEAINVLSCAEEVYRKFYDCLSFLPHPMYKITSWDVGLYQIRKALNEVGLVQEELTDLHNANNKLGQKILPQLYHYGFLQGQEHMFEDDDI